MSLFAIGDLHLSFSCSKPMDIFKGWENYTERLYNNWCEIISQGDTTVICGDISWAMNFEQLRPDFEFIESLPGKKIILKGNHDYWWTTLSKMNDFLEQNSFKTISFLHNNAYLCGDAAVCGTRGWVLENKKITEADKKVINREISRLERSIACAKKLSQTAICFLHYPPVFENYECEEITGLIRSSGIKQVYYGHIHGSACVGAVWGEYKSMDFHLVACDNVDFKPVLVL